MELRLIQKLVLISLAYNDGNYGHVTSCVVLLNTTLTLTL